MKRKSKLLTALMALVFTFSMTFTGQALVFAAPQGKLAPSAEVQVENDALDYVADVYDGVEFGHVFDVVTLDQLDFVMKQGIGDEKVAGAKSIIVFADSESAVAKAAIPEINTAAKANKIEKIYYADMLVASYEYAAEGDTDGGVNIWDNPEAYWPNATGHGSSSTLRMTDAFIKLGEYFKESIKLANYTAKTDVALFVWDEEKSEVATSVVINSASDLKSSEVNALLAGAASAATNYSDYDYFNSARWQVNRNYPEYALDSSFEIDYSAYKNNFKLRATTYYEMMHLLDIPGEHIIMASGSWCGDSKRAMPLVVENSSNQNSTTVYVFDFRLGSNLNSTGRDTSFVDVEGDDNRTEGYAFSKNDGPQHSINRVGYLGALMIEKLGNGYPTGIGNNALRYIKNGGYGIDLTDLSNIKDSDYVEMPTRKFRSPFLAKYNNNRKVTEGMAVATGATIEHHITDVWMHQRLDWEISGGASVGDFVDNELFSGSLSNTQKALSRYEMYLFFGGKAPVYGRPVPNISESNNGDSGCGDDNDPMNDLKNGNESIKLIANHGTSDYDVSKYEIDITLNGDPANGKRNQAAQATFTAKTVINATAAKELTEINLDFRQQAISKVLVNSTELTPGSGINQYSRNNNDLTDTQKLVLHLGTPISNGETFTVTVEYTVLTVDASVQVGSPQGFNVHTDALGYTVCGEPFGATYWYPCNNTPADGAKYIITMHANAAYTMISNGVRTSDTVDGANRTVIWTVDQDTAAYQIFATFSKNIIELNSAWFQGYSTIDTYKTLDGRTIPVHAYVNADIYNKYKSTVDRYYGMLPYYIKTLEGVFGAYPGKSLGFMIEDVGDGKGGSATWGAIECKDRPYYTGSSVTGQATFVHELVHQWFGDAIRLGDWESLWLNEGFATYGSDIFSDIIGMKPDANTAEGNSYEKYLNLYNNKDENSKLWSTPAHSVNTESDLFGNAKSAYNRGAMALVVLQHSVGGDKFFKALQGWVSKNSGKAMTTDDFIQYMKDSTYMSSLNDADIETWGNVWLKGKTKPASFTLTGAAGATAVTKDTTGYTVDANFPDNTMGNAQTGTVIDASVNESLPNRPYRNEDGTTPGGNDPENPDNNGGGNLTWLWILLGVVGAAGIGVGGFFLVKYLQKNKSKGE